MVSKEKIFPAAKAAASGTFHGKGRQALGAATLAFVAAA
jgi:hypothetical protein